jgi:ectoine hydroxylase-related dioxygenase (phytanoyl-CoA dioxygenase family)
MSELDVDRAAFERDGVVIVRRLFEPDVVKEAVVALDRLLAARDGEPTLAGAVVEERIHQRIQRMAERDRAGLGVVYDAVRKVLPFWRMLGSARMSHIVEVLLGTPHVGVAFRGAGIRMDLPFEDRWRSEWHQEYHSQMSSMRGLVAWFSLSAVDRSMGPVDLMLGSHREGALPVRCLDPLNTRKDYTQTFEIDGLSELGRRYEIASFETEPGDVVFLDFMLLHRSGFNRSTEGRSRLTCQVRYFDMTEPTGIKHGWVGGWQDGHNFAEIHPELVRS